MCLQERSRCFRLKLLETASSDNRSDSLFSPHALPSYAVSVILKRDMSPVSVAAGCASAVSQAPLKVIGHNLPAKVHPLSALS